MAVRILIGDARERLRDLQDGSVHCVVTSPPYFGLRDYGVKGQIGLEGTPEAYVQKMVEVFREVRRVLRDDGTLWLNLGDSYASYRDGKATPDTTRGDSKGTLVPKGSAKNRMASTFAGSSIKHKDLIGIPWRVAFALQADGWYLRQDIIWAKPNPMPESVTDRCTKAHEYLFLLSKSARYHYDAAAIAEPGVEPDRQRNDRIGGANGHTVRHSPGAMIGASATRNRRSVWTVATQPFSDWHETVHRERVASDAAVDGKKRTTSPDCPLHGDRAASASNAPCDGHADAPSRRNQRTGADLDQAQQADCAPIATIPARATGQHSLDLPALSSDPSATDRSKRSRRTGRDPATTLACTASAQTPARTDGTSAVREPSDSAAHMPANSNGRAGTGDHPSAQTTARNARSSSCDSSQCTCEWYIETTSKTSHFATFPPALIEPCILAGCPKGGTVLDPFGGAGTTGLVADRLQRDAVLIELNPEYAAMARRRIEGDAPLFAAGSV